MGCIAHCFFKHHLELGFKVECRAIVMFLMFFFLVVGVATRKILIPIPHCALSGWQILLFYFSSLSIWWWKLSKLALKINIFSVVITTSVVNLSPCFFFRFRMALVWRPLLIKSVHCTPRRLREFFALKILDVLSLSLSLWLSRRPERCYTNADCMHWCKIETKLNDLFEP